MHALLPAPNGLAVTGKEGIFLPDGPNRIARDGRIGRDYRQSVGDRLAYQHAIERIFVRRRQLTYLQCGNFVQR